MASIWLPARERAIVHVNVADFAVEVERVLDARLRDRPVIVAAQQAARAAVYDMSEEAYRAGVRKNMALRRAGRICPDARIVSPHPDRYERAMSALLKQSRPYSPLIETGEGNGHLFLDVTGVGRLWGPPSDVAWRIRREVEKDMGLSPIWAVAANKLVAKVASRIVKPVGEYIVPPGDEEAFLRPLPLHLLPIMEREDLDRMKEFHITLIGQAAAWQYEHCLALFGKRGRDIHQALRGIDATPVLPAGRTPRSVTVDHDFADDANDAAEVDAALFRMIEKAGADLRRMGKAARRVGLCLDYSDGVRVIRQSGDSGGSANDLKLFQWAKAALELAWRRRVRIRHLRVICDRLAEPAAQMALFAEEETGTRRQDSLAAAFDRIRTRFGPNGIQWGRTLPPTPS